MRLHGFDAARGILLSLGIVYHSLVFVFLYVQPSSVAEFLSIVFFHQLLHSFRMPAFFIVAGFFAVFLIDKRGRGSFLKNRYRRIVLPFLVFWPLLVVANHFASTWAKDASLEGLFPTMDTQHLWFLYFLAFFSIITWLAAPLMQKLGGVQFQFPLTATLAVLALVTPFIPGVIERELATSTLLVFDPGVFFFYFLAFSLGIVLFYGMKVMLPLVSKRSPIYVAFGSTAFTFFFISQDWGWWVSSFAYSFALWFLAVGTLGLFLRVASKENKTLRFISDSSYWLYLIHLPLVFVFLRTGSQLGWGAWPLAILAMTATFVIGILSYKVLVRHTPIGLFLNGTTHRRAKSN